MKQFLRDTQVDPERFRTGMARLAAAVNIIATRNGSVSSGLTASAVCSYSIQPPRLLACVNYAGDSFRHISQSRCMSVNVLAHSQEDLARRFAADSSGEEQEARFLHGSWTELVTGAPILQDCLVGFDCVVEEMLLAHSHAILIGEIKDLVVNADRPPLLYVNRMFTTAAGAVDPV